MDADWDGNTELGFKCWRKSFGKGHVSVGVGGFQLVSFSFGPDSDYSCSSTRWCYKDAPITPEEAMQSIDKHFARGYTNAGTWSHERQVLARKSY